MCSREAGAPEGYPHTAASDFSSPTLHLSCRHSPHSHKKRTVPTCRDVIRCTRIIGESYESAPFSPLPIAGLSAS
eukprot:883293-Pyramimonas_sp.AAC.1